MRRLRLLVTRPDPDARELALVLEARGHEAIVAPMIEITFDAAVAIPTSGLAAVIATSRNGLLAIAGRRELAALAGLPLFAVGAATAEAARRLGYTTVVEGEDGGAALLASIQAMIPAARGALLHLSGETIAIDLVASLASAGYAAKRVVVYRNRPITALSGAAIDGLRAGVVDAVLLFSPATAGAFLAALRHHGLAEAGAKIAHLCLSATVARALATEPSSSIRIAARPNLAAMLAVVDAMAAESVPLS